MISTLTWNFLTPVLYMYLFVFLKKSNHDRSKLDKQIPHFMDYDLCCAGEGNIALFVWWLHWNWKPASIEVAPIWTLPWKEKKYHQIEWVNWSCMHIRIIRPWWNLIQVLCHHAPSRYSDDRDCLLDRLRFSWCGRDLWFRGVGSSLNHVLCQVSFVILSCW